MSGWRGLVGGVVALALLEVVVSNSQAAGRVGGLFNTTAQLLSRWLDPYTPLVPDLRKKDGQYVNPFGPNGPAPGTPLATDKPSTSNAALSTPRRTAAPAPTPLQSVTV